jgi:hypothetical protein
MVSGNWFQYSVLKKTSELQKPKNIKTLLYLETHEQIKAEILKYVRNLRLILWDRAGIAQSV